MPYQLLEKFESLFKGSVFRHRANNQGDAVAAMFYEDLFHLGRSQKLVERISSHSRGINVGNKIIGTQARRGDGTFGEFVPNVVAIVEPSIHVPRGHLASMEIGCEVKILATAIGKQRRERVGDLNDQARIFESRGNETIRVGIVGVNHAAEYEAYEGTRVTRTDGKNYKHPVQEAAAAITLLKNEVAPNFDELLILPFAATNIRPFPFRWMDAELTNNEYGAVLVRVSNLYERRF
jgi:hypothetical protein